MSEEYKFITNDIIENQVNTPEKIEIKQQIEYYAKQYLEACIKMEQFTSDIICQVIIDAAALDINNQNKDVCDAAIKLKQLENYMLKLANLGVDHMIPLEISRRITDPTGLPYKIPV